MKEGINNARLFSSINEIDNKKTCCIFSQPNGTKLEFRLVMGKDEIVLQLTKEQVLELKSSIDMHLFSAEHIG